METLITKGIKVSVTTQFQLQHSNPAQKRFIHSYEVTIENNSEYIVQLMRRHWIIKDGYANVREVEGEGVIGEQPVLRPGQKHTYSSWSPIPTDIGSMGGTFLMLRQSDMNSFKVRVPEFSLVADYKLN